MNLKLRRRVEEIKNSILGSLENLDIGTKNRLEKMRFFMKSVEARYLRTKTNINTKVEFIENKVVSFGCSLPAKSKNIFGCEGFELNYIKEMHLKYGVTKVCEKNADIDTYFTYVYILLSCLLIKKSEKFFVENQRSKSILAVNFKSKNFLDEVFGLLERWSFINLRSAGFREMSWEDFFFETDLINERWEDNILFIVNEELDFESLQTTKKLVFHSNNLMKVKTWDGHTSGNIFHDDFIANKIEDIKSQSRFCFLLSSNLRIESSMLNSKIRAKYLNQNFNVFSLGLNFTSNLLVEFVNLNVLKIFETFEGKMLHLSRLFLDEKFPLLFVGSSLKQRVSSNSFLFFLLKKIMPSVILFEIGLCCNSYSSSFINIKPISRRSITNSKFLFLINMDDTIPVRYFIYMRRKAKLFWFNTYSSFLAFKSNFIVPTTSLLETEGIYFNLEGRPQKTFNTSARINQTLGIRSINLIFRALKFDYIRSNFMNYMSEIVEKPKCFSMTENIFVHFKPRISSVSNQVSAVSFYPIKPSLEDFYSKGLFCKKSSTMLKCSQDARKIATNF